MVKSKSLDEKWLSVFSNGSVESRADTPKRGGGREGFRPHELLEAALASCMNITVRMAAESRGLELDGVSTEVKLNREAEGVVFRYSLDVAGDLSGDDLDALQGAAAECPVHETLSGELSFREIG